MELHEFEIAQRRAGPCAGEQTAPQGAAWIGGRRIERPDAAGRQHDRAGGQAEGDAVPLAYDAAHAAIGILHQAVESGDEGLDRRRRLHGAHQCVENRAARRVAPRADDAATAVGGLQPEGQRAVRLTVETGAEGDEPLDQTRTRLRNAKRHVRLGEPGARGKRIVRVQRGCIIRPHCGGDAALGPAGGRTYPATPAPTTITRSEGLRAKMLIRRPAAVRRSGSA